MISIPEKPFLRTSRKISSFIHSDEGLSVQMSVPGSLQYVLANLAYQPRVDNSYLLSKMDPIQL